MGALPVSTERVQLTLRATQEGYGWQGFGIFFLEGKSVAYKNFRPDEG
jgi:hypothetical protein